MLKLVNLARAAYGAPELETLVGGQPHSASLCPIGRSLRKGVEDWLFVAVGSKYLRLWASGKDLLAVAAQIRTAWKMPGQLMLDPVNKSACVTIQLPAEMSEFIDRFDRGMLPNYEREVDPHEIHQLKELARAMPLSVERRIRRVSLPSTAKPTPLSISG